MLQGSFKPMDVMAKAVDSYGSSNCTVAVREPKAKLDGGFEPLNGLWRDCLWGPSLTHN